jgi:hypothetical protein
MTAAVIAAVAALLVGVIGGLLSYVNARRLSRTEAQLERVNAQLSELYGLFDLDRAGRTGWACGAPELRGP